MPTLQVTRRDFSPLTSWRAKHWHLAVFKAHRSTAKRIRRRTRGRRSRKINLILKHQTHSCALILQRLLRRSYRRFSFLLSDDFPSKFIAAINFANLNVFGDVTNHVHNYKAKNPSINIVFSKLNHS